MNELIADILEVLDPQDRTPFWKRLFRSERAFLASQYAIGNIHDEVQGTRYFERRPRVIYFYYLKFNQDGSLTAHEYRYFNKADPKTPDPGPEDDIDDKTDLFLPIEFKDLDGHILKLVENARGSQTKPAHYSVGNFQELLWKR
ncbi:MAG: hypothetical protein QOJ53_106, partial [Sphingomonadales bacterium]|nr:hypothetical protein [Sphingomonadales bacterium]